MARANDANSEQMHTTWAATPKLRESYSSLTPISLLNELYQYVDWSTQYELDYGRWEGV